MAGEVFSLTDAPERLSVEQSRRVRLYVVSMTVRTLCFVAAVVTPGVLRWVLVAGAVVLPYVSVVLANQAAKRRLR